MGVTSGTKIFRALRAHYAIINIICPPISEILPTPLTIIMGIVLKLCTLSIMDHMIALIMTNDSIVMDELSALTISKE